MEGDERVRFCRQCNLHVYNVASLTSAEAGSLISRTEGRLCARLYRRADGTVLTRDCPVGLAAARRRVARAAGAALAAILSLCGACAFGQGKGKDAESCATCASKVGRVASPGKGSALKGTVIDPAQGAIPNARVQLVARGSKRKYTAAASAEGAFEFAALPPGTYAVEVSGLGFQTFKLKQLAVGTDETVRLDVTLGLDPASFEMGVIVMQDETPTTRNGNGVTVFTGKEITRLPH
jgi:hypothetical protein